MRQHCYSQYYLRYWRRRNRCNVTGLPAGVTGTLCRKCIHHQRSAHYRSGSPFSYTVTATGPCANATVSGTITVNDDATLTLTSAPATTSQTVCISTAITAITYTLVGEQLAQRLQDSLLETGTYNAGTKVYTISGTPTVAGGPLTYTVTASGPCTSHTEPVL